MRIIVTGGAGFIGSTLVDTLLARGDEVLVIDDLSSGSSANLAAKAELVPHSVADPAAADAVVRWQPEIIFHLAAQIDVRRSVREPRLDADINIGGTIALAQAAAAAGVRRIVFSSTGGAIYGEQETFPAGEGHPSKPLSPYGVAKLCAEHYLSYFCSQSPMDAVSLRYGNVYGPRQDPYGEAGVVAIFAGKMLAGEVPLIHGDGSQTRDYVFVRDVVAANLAAVATAAAHGSYNIGTGVETDVNTLAHRIADAAGYTGEITHGPAVAGGQQRSVLDISRARKDLGWAPTMDIGAGLTETVRWFANR